MKKSTGVLSFLLVLLLGLAILLSPTVGAQEIKKGGTLSITDFSFTSARTLDPHIAQAAGSMRFIENLYNTLLKYKKGEYGSLEGDLAKEYSISDDGKVYIFKIHDGVKFHNGDDLTAEDVKYSIERIIEKEVRAQHFDAVENIEVIDELNLKITLKEPVAPFLTYLAYPMNAVVNKTIVEANDGSLNNADAGSGPFKLNVWERDQFLVLDKFEDYFEEGKPYLDRVYLKPIDDETARTTALRNDELDIILQVSAKNIDRLAQYPNINVESVAGTYWEYLGLNTKAGPLSNKKVRQAVAWAVNRDTLNQMVKFGKATPLTGGPIPPGHWADDELEVYPAQDLDRARELLAETDYSTGFDTTLIVLSNPDQLNAAQVIKAQLAPIGIDVEIRSLESSVYFENLGSGDFEMTVIGWVGFVDPDEYLYNIFHTDGIWNQQAYSNKEVDALLEEGRRVSDKEERRKIYREAQRMIAEDAPMVFLYVNPQASALQQSVKGFDVNPTVSTISLAETWIDE